MHWNDIAKKVTPYVVKIETPRGHGTGFLCFYTESDVFAAIATAYHVISRADTWREPMRIVHDSSKTTAFIRDEDRVVYNDPERDSAIILIGKPALPFPEALIPLRPIEDRLPVGSEVGWLGYPAVANTLCFFSGNVSAFEEWRNAYLIDGVAINGVSGGPVLYPHATEGVQIVGSISAYIANRVTGEALPGLSIAQDVSHYHQVAAHIRSFEEARRKKRADEQDPPPAAPSSAPPSEPGY